MELNPAGLSSSTQGKWDNLGPDRFLGVKFAIHGETHYGWIRVTLNVAKVNGVSGTITAYAYETVANKKIKAGCFDRNDHLEQQEEAGTDISASLGMLALGTPGLEIWRRAESSSSEPTGSNTD